MTFSRIAYNIFTMERNLFVFPDGLKLVHCRLDGVYSAYLSVMTGAGSGNESAENNGVSHCVEHMLFKGTKRRSAFAISDDIDKLGAQIRSGKVQFAFDVFRLFVKRLDEYEKFTAAALKKKPDLGTDEELPVLRVDSQKVAIPETPGSAILFDRPMTDNLAVATAAGTLYIYGTCTVFIQDGRNRNRIVVRLIPLGIKPVISDWKLDLEFVFVSADKPANVKTTAQ